MQDYIIQLFETFGIWALVISVVLNMIISILGVVPSVFLTAANIIVFGLPIGISVSIAGEAIGAVVSFILYRFGIKKVQKTTVPKHKWLQQLSHTNGWQAFWLIISLRILPFIPSGVVTFASAMSNVRLPTFAIASTIGKIPALFIEAFSVYGVLQAGWEIRITLASLSFVVLFTLYVRSKQKI